MARARMARHRLRRAGRLRPPLVHEGSLEVPEDGGEPPRGAAETIALEAIEQQPSSRQSALVFPAQRGGYLDLRNFRNREWKPAQLAAGIEPLRRIYDLRHTFATFALRAGISTFDLSRYMGASLTMIDRHYGHLPATDANMRSTCSTSSAPVNVHGGRWWTQRERRSGQPPPVETTEASAKHGETLSPLTDSNRRPPPDHSRAYMRDHSRHRFSCKSRRPRFPRCVARRRACRL